MHSVPAEFSELPPYGPFYQLVGPMYGCHRDGVPIVAMRMEHRHRNRANMMHGGMVAMLVDTALVWAARETKADQGALLTTNLAIDFIGQIREGDWVEARVEFVRTGRKINFVQCLLYVDDKVVARGNTQLLVIPETKN